MAILGDYEQIAEGDVVKCTGKILEVPVGAELIGRVVNALGQPIDGKGDVKAKETGQLKGLLQGYRAKISFPAVANWT